jgi:transcription antitermination factor NusG
MLARAYVGESEAIAAQGFTPGAQREPPPLPAAHPWFLLYVKPRHEKKVSALLRGRGYDEFLPLYGRRSASRSSELPLFPGYVFCRVDLTNRLPVLSVPGVFSIIGFAGKAVPVEEHEVEALKRAIHNNLRREPWPELPSGRTVTVSRGPMQGVQGVVLMQRKSTRVIITVTLLQRAVAVELDRTWLDEGSA